MARSTAALVLAALIATGAGEAEPVCVPEVFFDLAPEAGSVLEALRAAAPGGEFDGPVHVTRSSASWSGAQRRFALEAEGPSAIFVDVGLRTWRDLVPRLREEPRALLVGLAPGCAPLSEARRALRDAGVLERAVLLPLAAAREPGVRWGFGQTCGDRLLQDGEGCSGARQVAPTMSLDALLGLVLGSGALAGTLEELPELQLRVDAGGDEVEVLESLRPLAGLLTRSHRLQVRLPADPAEGQPGRKEALEMLRMLGFYLDFGLASAPHGDGECDVHLGCCSPDEGAEHCFLLRSEAAPHVALLDLSLRRPYELLRTYTVGSHGSGSKQIQEAMN